MPNAKFLYQWRRIQRGRVLETVGNFVLKMPMALTSKTERCMGRGASSIKDRSEVTLSRVRVPHECHLSLFLRTARVRCFTTRLIICWTDLVPVVPRVC